MCVSWPSKFEPFLSSFHPSAFSLAHKLKSSIKVKRELQEEEYKAAQASQDDIFESFWGSEEKEKETKPQAPKKQLKEHLDQHLIYSLEYYLSVNNPILGLLFFMVHKEGIQKTKSFCLMLF